MRRGIAIQVISVRNLAKQGNFQFCLNLSMKINSKLGGINFGHAGGSTSGGAGSSKGWLGRVPAMVFGADLTHMDGKPSIAVVVASMERSALSYSEEIPVEPLIEPAREGKSLFAFGPPRACFSYHLQGHLERNVKC